MAFGLSDCLYEGVCIVRIEGRLLLGPASDVFRRYLQRRLEDGIRLFVVMCDEFELADSTGVGDLVGAVSRIKSRGGRMIFVNVVSVQIQYFLSQLKSLVEIVPDLAAAFQSIAGHPVEVPAELQFEDRYTVGIEGKKGAQKLVVNDRTVDPPTKTEYQVREIPPVSQQRLSLPYMGGIALAALAILALLVFGLAWVAREVRLFLVISSVAVLFYLLLIAMVLLISGHLSEKLAGNLLFGILGKIPGLDKWIPKAVTRSTK